MKRVIGKKSIDIESEISPCPCCGGNNINFHKSIWEKNMEADARIWCEECGHEIKKNIDYLNSGIREPDLYCLECVIERWNDQSKKYAKTDKHKLTEELDHKNRLITALRYLIISKYNDPITAGLSDEDILHLMDNGYFVNYCS